MTAIKQTPFVLFILFVSFYDAYRREKQKQKEEWDNTYGMGNCISSAHYDSVDE